MQSVSPPAVPAQPGSAPDRLAHGVILPRRVGRWGFPVFELTSGGRVLATMGRLGWFRLFLGPGQRVELADGERWRIRSIGVAGAICPIIVDATRRKVAVAALGVGSYGINGRDYGYALYPAEERRLGRSNRWILRHFERELAVVTRRPLAVDAAHPVPLGAALLALVLVRYGIPGESAPRFPTFSWR